MDFEDRYRQAADDAVDDDLSKSRNTIARDNASKITNSPVLESNTWSFVIFDGLSWALLPYNRGGM